MAYAITRDEYSKRLSERSLFKTEDLEYIRDYIFEVISDGQSDIYNPAQNSKLQTIVEKYLYPSNITFG